MNEKKFSFLEYSFISKIIIVLGYSAILLFFLYMPRIYTFFFTPAKVINVFTFTDMIPSSVVKEFEDKTGIAVRLKYFDTNEELLAKLKIDNGAGYDLITTSDYAVDILRKDGLLIEIDKSRISNLKNIDQRFLGRYFDPENKYSLPIAWSVEGIVYKKDLFTDCKDKISWDLLYKKPVFNYEVCMPDGAREIIFLTAIYLYGKTNNLSSEEIEQIKQTLKDQKKWVEIYMSGSLQYYLFADIVPIAATSSAFAKKLLETSNDFNFVLPDKGSFIAIENIAIPSNSKKADLSYKFIDFLISTKSAALNFKQHGYNPTNKKAYQLIDKKFLNNNNFFPSNNMFDKLHIINNEIDNKKIEDLWLAVKLA